ncbi:hypothetical protein CSOJ01_09911 [Colletotrichum sojae]|uniref:Uncharacterized protein n=1 Tax=Colletotrichum sojae TaxID=2175907 RepID=A0A8H6J1S3_9PEZI|nr:hypothetical protein CSOJ01_09911 [Colletotrichum sojae]
MASINSTPGGSTTPRLQGHKIVTGDLLCRVELFTDNERAEDGQRYESLDFRNRETMAPSLGDLYYNPPSSSPRDRMVSPFQHLFTAVSFRLTPGYEYLDPTYGREQERTGTYRGCPRRIYSSPTAVRGLGEQTNFLMTHLTWFRFKLFQDRTQREGLHHSQPSINSWMVSVLSSTPYSCRPIRDPSAPAHDDKRAKHWKDQPEADSDLPHRPPVVVDDTVKLRDRLPKIPLTPEAE